MKKLQQHEWVFINDIIYFIYENEDFLNERNSFLSYISLLVPNDFSVFHLVDRTGEHYLTTPTVYVPGKKDGKSPKHVEAINKYIENYENEDYGQWLMAMGKRAVYRETDLVDAQTMKDTRYYNDTYAALEIKYSMQVISSYNNEFQGAIVLGRNGSHGDFTGNELYAMELINRHLSLRLYKEFHDDAVSHDREFSQATDLLFTLAEEHKLTRRETEVFFKVVKESLSNEDICDSLCISPHTLNKHLNHIYIKFGVNSRSALMHSVMSSVTVTD